MDRTVMAPCAVGYPRPCVTPHRKVQTHLIEQVQFALGGQPEQEVVCREGGVGEACIQRGTPQQASASSAAVPYLWSLSA
eukprot:15451374-Alexandrium_andersonii.AAC.1